MAYSEIGRHPNNVMSFTLDRQQRPLPRYGVTDFHVSPQEESPILSVEKTLQAFPQFADALTCGSNPDWARRKAIGRLETLQRHHPYSFEHSVKVAAIAQEVAGSFGLSRALIGRAGLLHDTGKAAVPLSILGASSDYEMSTEEILQLRSHVEEGVLFLREDRDRDVGEIIGAHHKFNTLDGRVPYPSWPPLNPHDMHFPYQVVIALADITDAARTNRGYQAQLSAEKTRVIIAQIFREKLDSLCNRPSMRGNRVNSDEILDRALAAKRWIDDAYAQIAA